MLLKMSTEFITRLHVLSASNLPKTDRFSAIDAYITITLGAQKFRTRTVDDSSDPTFNETFLATLPSAAPHGFLTGTIQISLFDQNVFSDEHVATCSVELDGKSPQDLRCMSIPLTFVKSKYSGLQAHLAIGLDGFVQSFQSLKHMFGGTPGFFFSDVKRACYFPFPHTQNMAYLAVEYEEQGKVDIKVRRTGNGRESALVQELTLN